MSEEAAKAVLLRDALALGCATKAQRERLIIDLLLSGEPLSQDVREVMADTLLPKDGSGRNEKPWDWPLALYVAGLMRQPLSPAMAEVCTGERAGMAYDDAVAKAAGEYGVSETTVKNAYSLLRDGQRKLASSKQ